MFNGDMDGTNNTSETINQTIMRKLSTIMRKRYTEITARHDSIMPHISDFDNLHPDQHISSLITTLKALGSF